MIIEAIMTRDIVSIEPGATLREAIRLIEDNEIRHLPVVKDKRLVGIVSDRDLREYRVPLMLEINSFDEAGRDRANDLLETPISEVMASDIVAVDSTESLASLVDAILEYKVGAVPVIDRRTDELVGIVSYIDVLRYAREHLLDSE